MSFARSSGCLVLLGVVMGCASTRTSDTSRTGMEQLLVSNAVDQTLDRTDFSNVRAKRVFVEEKYLDCVDKPYVLGALRHRVLDAGGAIVDAKDAADVVMEVRSGGIGTDNSERFVGIPGMALPGPMPVEIPEIRLWEKNSQYGTAKLAVVTYDAKAGQQLTSSGTRLARSDNSRWAVLGFSPGDTGSVHRELATIAGQQTGATFVANQLGADGQMRR